jgi:hypothetical protein
MTKLNRSALKQLIVKEMKKIMDEEIIFSKNAALNRGMLGRHDDPGRQTMYTSCSECGSKMYEGESVCEQCGSMYEAELNEGDCGCGTCSTCAPNNADLDYNFIPDHMQHDLLNQFPQMKNIEVEVEYDDDVKIGNHKIFKGSYMAKSHLYKVHKYAEKLYHMIPDGHNLEDWMRTKLAQIADDIGEVYHALDHDIFEGDV